MADVAPAEILRAQRGRAAERLRGMFGGVAADRSLVDELIAERRAEACADGAASEARPLGRDA